MDMQLTFLKLQTTLISLQGLDNFFNQPFSPRNFLLRKCLDLPPSHYSSCISVALTIPQTAQPSEHLQQLCSASQIPDPHGQHEPLFCLQTEPHGARWSEVGTGDSLFHSLTCNMIKRHTKICGKLLRKTNASIKVILTCCILQASKSKAKAFPFLQLFNNNRLNCIKTRFQFFISNQFYSTL